MRCFKSSYLNQWFSFYPAGTINKLDLKKQLNMIFYRSILSVIVLVFLFLLMTNAADNYAKKMGNLQL